MTEKFEHKGRWKLPNNDECFDGTLSFDPDFGVNLEVFGTFNKGLFNRESKEIIIGETTSGNITLVDNWYKTRKTTSNGVVITQYKPGFVFIGQHFEEIERIAFCNVSFRLFNLFPWLNKNGLKFKDLHNEDFSLIYNKPGDIEFSLNDKCNGKITFQSLIHQKEPFNRFEMEEHAIINLEYTEPLAYKEILKDIHHFVGFLTLCCFEQSYPIEIAFKDDRYFEEFNGKQIPLRIECIYQYTAFSNKHKVRYKHEHLVPFEGIEEEFSNIIKNWHLSFIELEPVLNLMLSSFKNKYFFSVDKFMDNIRALESFHRKKHSNCRIPQKEYQEKVDNIINSVNLDKKDIEWLSIKLKYGNEPSLNKRLKELLQENQNEYIKTQISNIPKFCISIVDTRNYYTHYDNSDKNKNVLVGAEFYVASQKIMALLYSCILKYIEIPESCFEEGLDFNLK